MRSCRLTHTCKSQPPHPSPSAQPLRRRHSQDDLWQHSPINARLVQVEAQGRLPFRQARLPRSVRVLYPRDAETLAAVWTQRRLFIVAEVENQVRGYLSVMEAPMNDTGWVAEFAVERKVRRQGIGAALISSTVDWARNVGLRRLLIEVQSKNYPAISFCQKHGFAFCGYNDLYFANQDIALFFGTLL